MTRVAADVAGLDDCGTIEPGARADLVVCEGNPLADCSVLKSPETVLLDGRAVAGRPLAPP